jgi:hypothetical protein
MTTSPTAATNGPSPPVISSETSAVGGDELLQPMAVVSVRAESARKSSRRGMVRTWRGVNMGSQRVISAKRAFTSFFTSVFGSPRAGSKCSADLVWS